MTLFLRFFNIFLVLCFFLDFRAVFIFFVLCEAPAFLSSPLRGRLSLPANFYMQRKKCAKTESQLPLHTYLPCMADASQSAFIDIPEISRTNISMHTKKPDLRRAFFVFLVRFAILISELQLRQLLLTEL